MADPVIHGGSLGVEFALCDLTLYTFPHLPPLAHPVSVVRDATRVRWGRSISRLAAGSIGSRRRRLAWSGLAAVARRDKQSAIEAI